MKTPESIRTSLIPGEWVSSIGLSDAYLHIAIHPHSRKYLRFCHRSQVFQFSSLPFGLSTAPQVFTMIVKEVKLMALSRGLRLHQYLDTWLIRSQSRQEALVNTQAVLDLTQSFGWIINQKKIRTESFRTKFYSRSVVTPGKRATHKRPRIESCLSGPETLQILVSGPNSASCDGQLNCGSLHKQTRRNTLSGDVRTPVENHDLVPSLSHNIESQAHSRVPECDGRPAVQVESGPVDGMVTTSTDMSMVVHSPRGPVYHSSEPQASTVHVSYPRPQGLGHRCSKHKLYGSHCLCFPSNGSPSQGDPKIRQCHCLIIVIAPGWPGMPWFGT